MFYARPWENCKAIAAVDEIIALKGTVEPPRDKNQSRPVFVVSSIQDINKLVRAAAKKAAEALPPEASAEPSAKNPGESSGAADSNGTKNESREIHIRLASRVANNETDLYSLRSCLEENPGPSQVFIHVPAASPPGGSSGETIIRVSDRISASVPASLDALAKCPAVEDVWSREMRPRVLK